MSDFKRINCGECCGPVPVNKKEINEISKAIIEMPEKYRNRLINQQRPDLTCPLRDIESKKYSVYSTRPWVCRAYGHLDKLKCSNNKVIYNSGITEYKKMPVVGVLGITLGWEELQNDISKKNR